MTVGQDRNILSVEGCSLSWRWVFEYRSKEWEKILAKEKERNKKSERMIIKKTLPAIKKLLSLKDLSKVDTSISFEDDLSKEESGPIQTGLKLDVKKRKFVLVTARFLGNHSRNNVSSEFVITNAHLDRRVVDDLIKAVVKKFK